jgi:hypothetical protein
MFRRCRVLKVMFRCIRTGVIASSMSSPPLFHVAGASTPPIHAFDLMCAKVRVVRRSARLQERDLEVHCLFYFKRGVLVLGTHGVLRARHWVARNAFLHSGSTLFLVCTFAEGVGAPCSWGTYCGT